MPGMRKGEEGMNRWSTDFHNSENIPYDTVIMDTYYITFVQPHRLHNTKNDHHVSTCIYQQ